jgi:hypothetical protein
VSAQISHICIFFRHFELCPAETKKNRAQGWARPKKWTGNTLVSGYFAPFAEDFSSSEASFDPVGARVGFFTALSELAAQFTALFSPAFFAVSPADEAAKLSDEDPRTTIIIKTEKIFIT